MAKVLKLASGVPSGKLKDPPNSCMPRRAKMRMNKKSRNNREMIDLMELSREMTRLRREAQYLSGGSEVSCVTLMIYLLLQTMKN